MHTYMQYLLLFGANLRHLIWHIHGALLVFMPLMIALFVGMYGFATAYSIVLWAALVRPSILNKNTNYYLTFYQPLLFLTVLNWGCITLVSWNLFVLALVLSVLFVGNFFVLDSGMRMHRLINLPGLARLYIRTAVVALPGALVLVALQKISIFISLGIALPLIVLAVALIYYSVLYKDFGNYYGEI